MSWKSLGAILAFLSTATLAATLPYQGLATDSKGNPRADGTVPAVFALYSSATGGTPLWTETQSVATRKGLFSTSLGSVTAIPDSLLDGRALWLGVAMDGGTEATSRLAIQAPPYAARAGKARQATVADSAARAGGTDSLGRVVERLQSAMASLKANDSARIARDSSLLAAQARTIAALSALLRGASRSGNTLYFDSMNLSVRNGTGRTDSANGLGNLVIGYNEPRSSGNVRTGSHMVVVGELLNYSRYGGIVAGVDNSATGAFASVTGGRWSDATGDYSSVLGGTDNHAEGAYSCVSGGSGNVASGSYASVSGGVGNTAEAGYSSVVGGGGNVAGTSNGGRWSTILGGKSITTATDYASVP